MKPRAVAEVDRHVAGAGLGLASRSAPRCRSARGRARSSPAARGCTRARRRRWRSTPLQRSGSPSCSSTRSTRSSTWSRSRTCLPRAAVADVGERAAEEVAEQPPGEDALVDLAHLPGAGDHAAAVDHRAQAEGVGVLLDQQLGGELGRPVEGARAGQREVLGDPRRPGAGDGLLGGQLEAGLGLLQRQLELRGDRVDAAGREEDDEGVLARAPARGS